MSDPFDDLLKDPTFGTPAAAAPPADVPPEPVASGPTKDASKEPSPFSSVVEEATKPVDVEASIWNALPRGVNGIKQGANMSWFSTQRLAGGAPDPTSTLDSIAAGEVYDKLYPKTQGEIDAERKFFQEGDWSQLLNPRFVASTALESLPSVVGPIVGSIAGGAAGSLAGPVGTAAGVFAGTGAGSGIIDYGAAYKDYLTKKLGSFDRAKWDDAFRNDPNLLDEAHAWAAKHSSMVAAFDMLGMKVGGALAKPALMAGTSIGRRAAAVGGGIAAEGITETAGESTGSALASGGSDWNIKEAVLGGVAAAATGGSHSFIEPILGKITGHGEPVGASTDPAIEKAFRSFSGLPEIAADPTGAPLASSAQAQGPIWRSGLRDAVEAKGPNSADASQWINTIRNQPGVKQEEIDYTGVENWLRGQTGKISKSDVVAEIEANQVDVREVELKQNEHSMDEDPQTRFSRHTLPGGENYKELLLTLPKRSEGETWGDRAQKLFPGTAYADLSVAQRADLATSFEKSDISDNNFQSSHFPGVPNILAHVRFNERVDVDGQPTLHLEEIQSDWHQEGRKEGYKPTDPNEEARLLQDYTTKQDTADKVFQELRQDVIHGRSNTDDPVNHPRYTAVEAPMMEAYHAWRKAKTAPPDAPFKSTWHELAFKRMLRYAADNGFSRITWTPADEQIRRYDAGTAVQGVPMRLDATQERGMKEFYDKILPSVAKKWAKRFGGSYGETKLEVPSDPSDPLGLVRHIDVPYVDVPAAAAGVIQRGLPAFSAAAPDRFTKARNLDEKAIFDPNVANRAADVTKLYPAMIELKNKLQIKTPIRLHIYSDLSDIAVYGRLISAEDGSYTMMVNLGMHSQPSELWATMTHELGHAMFFDKFATAPTHVQMGIRAAYENFRQELKPDDTLESLFLRRDNAVSNLQRAGQGQISLYSLTPEQRKYWSGFDEWAAEQVVKWANTDARALTIVEKWFKAMAANLKSLLKLAKMVFQKNEPGAFQPDITVASWLNSYIDSGPEIGSPTFVEVDQQTKQDNQDITSEESPHVEASPQTFATQPFREGMKVLFESKVPRQVVAMAAQGDKINKFQELMLSVQQLAARNPHIRSLQLYKEDIALWQLEKQRKMDGALTTLKSWRKIRGPQADAVSTLIDEMMNMTYLKPKEAARMPTQAEFDAMVRRLGVSDKGLAVFTAITTDFSKMLDDYQNLLIREAGKIIDPISKFQAIVDINGAITRMRKSPYFPAMRFGNFTLTVRNANGKIIHFETFEKQRTAKSALDAIRSQLPAGSIPSLGVLPKDARPLLGMPPGLLNMIGEKLTLSPTQKEALEQLRFELSPQQSFKHRFQRKKLIKGYSTDFQRAYANYMFHGANHFARIKYADQLRDHVRDVREQAKFMPDGVNRGRIANFMSDHLQNVLDPKPDFVRLRSMMFMWALAFSPAAAGVNLTQTMVISYPYLASKFGDVKALRAMISAGGRVSSFYKRGKYENSTDLEFQAINEAVKEGVISEAMAPELAAVSEGRNLGKGWGGNTAERAWTKFAEMGSWMFEMTEQVNRRIMFRAAFNLAMQNPGLKHIKEVVATNSRQYDRLRTAGWTEQAASAFVVAKQATEATQYQYSAAAQPRFMRGKLRTVFVFKSFVQNTMFFLWNYPAAAVRSMLIMGFLGGLMGIPGADDLKDILKVIGWNFFGKNFNLEFEVRKFVMEMAGGHIDPDSLLHGVARKGYGIPAVMDMLGGTVGVNVPYPSLDRSRAVGIGNLSPLPLAPLFGPPSKDENRGIADSVQKASGAAFGLGFNIVKAISDSQLNASDPKRWEKAMPRALASVSRAYRAFSEGGERNRSGASVMKFDINDTEQMMEVLAMAGGYTPTRLSQKWDKVLAQQEFSQYWTLRKQGILKQIYEAQEGNDGDEVERAFEAMRKYNKDLSPEIQDLKITDKSVEKSMAARHRSREAQESGVPVQKTQRGLYDMFDKLYPGVQVEVRKR